MEDTLPEHDVVLLGIGHTNAHILRQWRMSPLPRARLTCISPFSTATYSGMLPGVLAGQYSSSRMEIDLVRLCAAAGARFVNGHVTGLDRGAKRLLFDDRSSLAYDLLSVGIGSQPDLHNVECSDESVITIKPMQLFLSRLEKRLDRLLSAGKSSINVVVVGAGAGGVEIALGLPTRLGSILQHLPYRLTLVGADERVLGNVTDRTVSRAVQSLRERRVELELGRRVTSAGGGQVTLDDGTTLPADLIVWATGAVGAPLLGRLGLSTDDRGFLRTRRTLQSLDDDAVFAVGDSGSIDGESIPKAGVYAVRQGPILWDNLGRYLRGERLVEYHPQRSFLKLFNTGDGGAIGEYHGFTFSGHWAWWLKDRIDSKFMRMYQDYRPRGMNGMRGDSNSSPRAPAVITSSGGNSHPARDRRIRCAGCGGKVGGQVLSRALARLDISSSEYVPLGLDHPDDAAVLRPPPGQGINVTVDFFAAPLDDPFLVGRIAALNAASDCFAMGARPLAALASVAFPPGPESKQEQLLYELLAGALHEFCPMGAVLAGGHTIEGSPLTVGFSMVAAQTTEPRLKSGLRPGDCLVLTKPLGIGVLLSANMQARCEASWWESLLHTMLLSNQYASSLCDEFSILGVTDVSGFGLAGHLLEMLRASDAAAELRLDQIPLLPGVEELLREGWESTLAPANQAWSRELDESSVPREEVRYRVLFDPQTSGGLLLGVPEAHTRQVLGRLAQQSEVPAAVIGRVLPAQAGEPRLRLR